MIQPDRPKEPLPEPLLGTEMGSFAELSVTVRLPRILRETLAVNDFPAQAMARLEQLLADIPQAGVRLLKDPGAPDEAGWAEYVRPYLGQNWLQVPWFFAETYFYRRILEATGYFQAGPTQGVDPFAKHKEQVLALAQPLLQALGRQLNELITEAQIDPGQKARGLKRLILLNIWSNQADLSMWSADEEGRPDHSELQQQLAHLLVDDTDAVMEYLFSFTRRSPRVDFILDNAGPELLYDLALTDFLLTMELAGSVRYHAKFHPTFVSDAMLKDISATVDYLASHPEPGLRALAGRLREHQIKGRLEMQVDPFWNTPLPMWEMPARIRRTLEGVDLIISKGDANYRRLLGDRHWPPATPFNDVLRYLPAPLLALRVAKAEIAVGLKPGQAEALDRLDPDWMVNGQWGLIQFTMR